MAARAVKRIGRGLIVLIGGMVLLMGLLYVLILLPSVQGWITGKAEQYLEQTLRTEAQIGAIRFAPLRSLQLRDVYVAGPEGDTLLYGRRIRAGFSLHRLWQKEFHIRTVTLQTTQVGLSRAHQAWLGERFPPNPAPQPKPEPAAPWDIVMDPGRVHVQKLGFLFQSPGLSLDIHAGNLDLRIDRAGLAAMDFRLERCLLENTIVTLEQVPITSAAEPERGGEGGAAVPIAAALKVLEGRNLSFHLVQPGNTLATHLDRLQADDIDFLLNAAGPQVELRQVEMDGGSFRMDRDTAVSQGFDADHLNFGEIGLMADSIVFSLESWKADLRRVQASLPGGPQVEDLRGRCRFAQNQITVTDLELATAGSRVEAPRGAVRLPAPSVPLGLDFPLIAGRLHPADVEYFVPQFRETAWWQALFTGPLHLTAGVGGTLERLRLSPTTLRLPGHLLQFNGFIDQPTQPDRLLVDVPDLRLHAEVGAWSRLLATDSLPEGVVLPSALDLQARIRGRLRQLDTEASGSWTYPGFTAAGGWSAFLQLHDLQRPDSLRLALRLDSLAVTDSTLRALLPAGQSLADKLPERMVVRGNAAGRTDSLHGRLQFAALRDGRPDVEAAAVVDYQNYGGLRLEGILEALRVSPEEIERWLPDSVRPAGLVVPSVGLISGPFAYRSGYLRVDADIETGAGALNVAMLRQGAAIQLDLAAPELRPDRLLSDSILQRIPSHKLSPLQVRSRTRLRGTSLRTLTAYTDSRIIPLASRLQWRNGLQVTGTAANGLLDLQLSVAERDMRMTGDGRADLREAEATLDFDFTLDKLDLQAMELVEQPFELKTRMHLQGRGSNLNDLAATFAVDTLLIRYDSIREQLDTLSLVVDFTDERKTLRLRSAPLEVGMEGTFTFPQVARQLGRRMQNHFRPVPLAPPPSDTLEHAFDFFLALREPRIFASGLIPSLRGLSEFRLEGQYDSEAEFAYLEARIPYLFWNQTIVDHLHLVADAQGDDLNYLLQMDNLRQGGQVDVRNLLLIGWGRAGAFHNELVQKDDQDSIRFSIAADIAEQDSLRTLSLGPELILNYRPWSIPADNRIAIGPDRLEIEQWELGRGRQKVRLLAHPTDKQGVVMEFEQFQLALISNIIRYQKGLFGGTLGGRVAATDLLGKPRVGAELQVDSLGSLGALLGRMELSVAGVVGQTLTFDAGLHGEGNDLTLAGAYAPGTSRPLTVDLDLAALNLASVRPMSRGALAGLDGYVQGDLSLSGDPARLAARGYLEVSQAEVRPAISQVTYRIAQQRVEFSEGGIRLRNFTLSDTLGRQAVVDGWVRTADYRNFTADLTARADRFLVLNTRREDNDLYYGRLFASWQLAVDGNLFAPEIRLNAQPAAGSHLNYIYPLNRVGRVDLGEGLVEFVAIREDTLNIYRPYRAQDNPFPDLGPSVSVDIRVTDALTVEAIMNEATGDRFTGKFAGDLGYRLQSEGDMELVGKLEIVEGRYQFNYSDVIGRTFELEKGSSLYWTGDPMQPELDLQTNYNTLTNTLALVQGYMDQELSPEQVRQYRQRETFVASVQVTGSMQDMDLLTDIAYPEVPGNRNDPLIRSALAQLRTDASRMNTQVFSLILFNGFLAQGGAAGGFDLDISSGLSDLITRQLNRLANQYIQFVDLELGFESEAERVESLFEDANLRISLRKTFLQERLIVSIDGVASTRNDPADGTEKAFLDNITVEYLLTPTGQLRLKFYDRREREDLVGGNTVRLGGALVFSRDFDKISFRNNRKQGTN